MAYVSEEQECLGPRYFDSGSSSQIVGTVSNLQNVKKAKGANITSRDKGDGMPQLKEGVKNICEPGYKEHHVKAHHMKVLDVQSQSDLKGTKNDVGSEEKSGSEEQFGSD
ncbi:unnamed protein product [Arabis nemorensis]|uniref:Uncharacterized protein n=1 Tax=Arabis nemorensis TaxID=586526 RepID=A0A565CSI4_9BRAS|nr:unnamed protein product [Arabis nemorensis]